jgi:hypothetical protein
VARHIPVRALVQGVKAEQVCAGSSRRRGTLGCPRNRGAVVASNPESPLVDVSGLGQYVLVGDDSGQLEVGDREGPPGTLRGDEGQLDVGRKLGAPHKGVCHGIQGIKPNAPHADSTSVASAGVRWRHRDQFPQARRPLGHRVHEETKVRNDIKHVAIQADAMLVAFAERGLQHGEQTS